MMEQFSAYVPPAFTKAKKNRRKDIKRMDIRKKLKMQRLMNAARAEGGVGEPTGTEAGASSGDEEGGGQGGEGIREGTGEGTESPGFGGMHVAGMHQHFGRHGSSPHIEHVEIHDDVPGELIKLSACEPRDVLYRFHGKVKVKFQAK
jgi:hypothetical protein